MGSRRPNAQSALSVSVTTATCQLTYRADSAPLAAFTSLYTSFQSNVFNLKDLVHLCLPLAEHADPRFQVPEVWFRFRVDVPTLSMGILPSLGQMYYRHRMRGMPA